MRGPCPPKAQLSSPIPLLLSPSPHPSPLPFSTHLVPSPPPPFYSPSPPLPATPLHTPSLPVLPPVPSPSRILLLPPLWEPISSPKTLTETRTTCSAPCPPKQPDSPQPHPLCTWVPHHTPGWGGDDLNLIVPLLGSGSTRGVWGGTKQGRGPPDLASPPPTAPPTRPRQPSPSAILPSTLGR